MSMYQMMQNERFRRQHMDRRDRQEPRRRMYSLMQKQKSRQQEGESDSRRSGFMSDAYRDCDHPRMELRIRHWAQDSHNFLRLQCEMCDTQLCESMTSQAGGEPQVTILEEEWCEGPKGFKSPELALKAGIPKR